MKHTKKIILLMLALCLALCLTACGSQKENTDDSNTPSNTESDASSADAGENTGTSVQKPVLLVVSFGSSYNETRDLTIGAIEKRFRMPTLTMKYAVLSQRKQLSFRDVHRTPGKMPKEVIKEKIQEYIKWIWEK